MNNLQQRFSSALNENVCNHSLELSKVAVAVSGGADSLALVLLMNDYARVANFKIVALTVNHHLRPEATEEAEYVANLMQKCGIEHHILEWQHHLLLSGIETKAREARYDLLLNWCRQNNFPYLMTAHHLHDQAETFFIRLQRGSGVDGLASMSFVTVRDGIKIIRPLLNIEPEELRQFLTAQNIAWREDASNQCDDYLRVRVRKILPLLEQELGLTVAKIGSAVAALGDARDYFEIQVQRFIKNHCRNWYGCAWSFSPLSFAALHHELKMRTAAELIKNVGKNEYSPEYQSLKRLLSALNSDEFAGATLGGCEIIRFQNKIWIIPEFKTSEVLSKTQWSKFSEQHQEILKNGLPYKLKLYLWKKWQSS